MQTQPAFSQDNKKCPLISFVITYYNEPEELLQKCIETITTLDLEEDEREIILVDDGSERSPLESLGDSANQLIYIRQPNKGLSQARNMGIELATGKYIQFIDADDYLLQGYYEQCIDIAKQKDADMVLFHETDKEQKTESINIEGPLTGTEFMHNHNLRASACGYFFNKFTIPTQNPTTTEKEKSISPKKTIKNGKKKDSKMQNKSSANSTTKQTCYQVRNEQHSKEEWHN